MSFKNVLAAEVLKTKRTYILTASILLPVIITGLTYAMNIKLFSTMEDLGFNPWTSFCMFAFPCYAFLYPMLVFLIGFRLYDIEHKSSGFKHLFILPVPKTHFYYSKAVIIIFCLFISLLIGLSLILIGGKFCSIFFPLMQFQDYTIKSLMIAFFVKLFFFNLSIIAIQLLLSLYFNNAIKSIGIPLILLIIGALMGKWEYNYLFPYNYSFQASAGFRSGEGFLINKTCCWSILYSVLFFILGALIVRLQRVHNR